MSSSVSIPQRILNMAHWYEKGSARNAREEAYAIAKEPTTNNYQKWMQEEVLVILEADRTAPESDSSSSSSSSQERPLKRRTVDTTSRLPKVLDVHWQALRVCNKSENQAFFLRVKARALRALVIKNRLENLPEGPRGNLMSWLKTQDLCALSGCSTELNYRIQNMPKIWQNLGTAFELPRDYWPNNDFSKKRCVDNFLSIAGANRELRKWTAESSPLLPPISAWSRRSALQLRSEIVDPQEHFTRHTLPVMTSLLTQEGYGAGFNRNHFDMRKTERGVIPFGPHADHFGDLLSRRPTPENPLGLINLFWTCGYPIHRQVLGCVMREFAVQKTRQALSTELASAWLNTLERMASCIPCWAPPVEDRARYRWDFTTNNPLTVISLVLYDRNYSFRGVISSEEANRLEMLVLQLLQKSETSYHDLNVYLQSYLPFRFFTAIVDAMKDKSHLPRLIYSFLQRSFLDWDSHFEADAALPLTLEEPLKNPCQFTPENILAAAGLFKGPRGYEHHSASNQWHVNDKGPSWIYYAAKKQSRQLMDLLLAIGIPYQSSDPDTYGKPASNSLTVALFYDAPPEVIRFLREYGVKPSPYAVTCIHWYIATYAQTRDVSELKAILAQQ